MTMESLRCCPYKIIFMDQNMPIMDGLESTREIRKLLNAHLEETGQDLRDLPICALTANDTAKERAACLNSGMSDFLTKPPDMNEFKKVLKNVFPDFE